VKVSKQGR